MSRTLFIVTIGKDGRTEFQVESDSDSECDKDAAAIEAIASLLGLEATDGTGPAYRPATPEATADKSVFRKKVRS